MDTCDLIIRAGRALCPASGLDAPGAVSIRDGRIAACSKESALQCRQSLDFPDGVLLPGLVDLHAHPATSLSIFGIHPDQHMLERGTTTVLSQGDAGAATCDQYVRDTIASSQTRVILAINLSSIGEAGPGGCFESISAIDVDACVSAIERHRQHIWGIAINTSRRCCGSTDPHEVLRRGLRVAAQTGLPILYGMRGSQDWPIQDQLELLRPGDVVTYCFRSTPHCIVDRGRVLPSVRDARSRGILFDVGHGCGSFNFDVATIALEDGFYPDTISTDLQRGHLGQRPVHDMPLVMSKLMAAGMPQAEVFAAATWRPARILRLEDVIGSLTVGSCADLVVLRSNSNHEPLADVYGQHRLGERWEVVTTIRAGRFVEKANPDHRIS